MEISMIIPWRPERVRREGGVHERAVRLDPVDDGPLRRLSARPASKIAAEEDEAHGAVRGQHGELLRGEDGVGAHESADGHDGQARVDDDGSGEPRVERGEQITLAVAIGPQEREEPSVSSDAVAALPDGKIVTGRRAGQRGIGQHDVGAAEAGAERPGEGGDEERAERDAERHGEPRRWPAHAAIYNDKETT